MKDAGCEIPLSVESYADVKEELNEVQQIMDALVSDICKMKVQHGQSKVPIVEPKQELDNKKVQIVVDFSTLASLFVGFVGVLIGVIAVVMWN